MRLFRILNVTYALRRKLQTSVCLAGIALGISAIVGIDLSNHSALASFRKAVEVATGKATHQIVPSGAADFDETVLAKVQGVPGVEAAAPIIEQVVPVEEASGETIRVLGIDPLLDEPFRADLAAEEDDNSVTSSLAAFLSQPGLVKVTRRFAARHHLEPNQDIHVTAVDARTTLMIAQLFDPESFRESAENLAVIDVATAQEIFGKNRRIDRIDLICSSEAARKISGLLPPGLRLDQPSDRTTRVDGMVESFRLNLTVLSLLALFVGWFLIYNTLTFSVIQRRRDIGILRCLGMTRGQITGMFLAEAVLLGLVGSLMGTCLGLLLARQSLTLVTTAISTLFVPVKAGQLVPDAALITKALALGICTSLVAALAPAMEAARVRPVAAVARTSIDVKMRHSAFWLALAGVVTLAFAFVMAWLPSRSLTPGYLSATAIKAGFACLTPLLAMGIVRVAAPLARAGGGMIALLGVRNITASLSRTGPAIAALMACLSVTIAIGLLIGSFHRSIVTWIDDTVAGDVWVQSSGWNSQDNTSGIPSDFQDRLLADPDVADFELIAQRDLTLGQAPIKLLARDFSVRGRGPRYHFLEGDEESAYQAMSEGGSVVISETLRYATGAHVGSTIELPCPDGPRVFRVAGVNRDYSAHIGRVMVDRDAFLRTWGQRGDQYAIAYLHTGADPDAVVRRLRTAAGRAGNLVIESNRSVRRELMHIFDSTMAVTYAAQVLATLVASCGILFALMALLFERTRELGTLRALGMTFRQIAAMVIVEAAVIGIIAMAIGTVSGICEGAVLTRVINVRSYGWHVGLELPPVVFGKNAAVALGAALLATLYPILRLRRLSVNAAIHEE